MFGGKTSWVSIDWTVFSFLLELHRYCISHFARVSFVPKWSYGQECKIVGQLCNVGISTWSQACAPLGNSVTMKFDMSIFGGFVKISGNECRTTDDVSWCFMFAGSPMDNWFNSTGFSSKLPIHIAKVQGAWDPCHDNSEEWLIHMAQTQTCDFPF